MHPSTQTINNEYPFASKKSKGWRNFYSAYDFVTLETYCFPRVHLAGFAWLDVWISNEVNMKLPENNASPSVHTKIVLVRPNIVKHVFLAEEIYQNNFLYENVAWRLQLRYENMQCSKRSELPVNERQVDSLLVYLAIA